MMPAQPQVTVVSQQQQQQPVAYQRTYQDDRVTYFTSSSQACTFTTVAIEL